MSKNFTQLKDILTKADHEPPFMCELLNDPKRTLEKNGFQLSDEDIRKLELFVVSNHKTQFAIFVMFGIQPTSVADEADQWGIGAGCCNSKVL